MIIFHIFVDCTTELSANTTISKLKYKIIVTERKYLFYLFPQLNALLFMQGIYLLLSYHLGRLIK